MKKCNLWLSTVALALAASLVFTGCFSSPAPAPASAPGISGGKAQYATVTFRNLTGQTIFYLYISERTNEDWGSDWLDSDEVFSENDTFTVRLSPGEYDVLATDLHEDTAWRFWIKVDASGGTFSIEPEDLVTGGTSSQPAQGASDFQYTEKGGGIVITGYTGSSKAVVIPAQINGRPVTELGMNAFKEKGLTSVVLPNTLVTIGFGAFNDNQLTSISIPASVTTIDMYAFWKNRLTSLTIPSTVKMIGNYAFANNQLTSIVIPSSITVLSDSVFESNLLTSATIPGTIRTIDRGAFWDNKLTSIVIPPSVTTIGTHAFTSNLTITSITIGANVTLGTEQYQAFSNDFDAYYNSNGKRAGTYTYSNRAWSRR